jgi:glycosyltransferase involved in cell wall biosynthesis
MSNSDPKGRLLDVSAGFGGPVSISVVVPVGGVDRLLYEQLDALARQVDAPPWELILSLNSVAAQGVVVPLAISQWKLVDSSDVAGPSHARNIGAQQARSGRLAFCDADDVVCPRWLAELGASLETSDIVGGIYEEKSLNPRSYKWREGNSTVGEPVYGFLPSAWGGNLGISASTFIAAGGFPADLRSGEDVTLCWRAQLAGASIAFNENAIVHYRHRTTIRATAKQHFTYAKELVRVLELFRPLGLRASPIRMAISIPLSMVRSSVHNRSFSIGRLVRDLSISAGLLRGVCRRQEAPKAQTLNGKSHEHSQLPE